MIIETHFQDVEGQDLKKSVKTVRLGDSHLFGVANDTFADVDGNISIALGFSNEPVTTLEDTEVILQFLTTESLDIFIDRLKELKKQHIKNTKG